MAKSFFEKLGKSLHLEDEQNEDLLADGGAESTIVLQDAQGLQLRGPVRVGVVGANDQIVLKPQVDEIGQGILSLARDEEVVGFEKLLLQVELLLP